MCDDLELPGPCPRCGHELTTGDIDYQLRGDNIVSMLICPKCDFEQELDTTRMDDIDYDDDEEDEDFDPWTSLKDPDEEDEEDEEDEDGADMFPNGRDYDAEDEDGPF